MSVANSYERQMLDLINLERTSRGLNPLQLELRLNDSAETHSQWMLQQDVFSHTGAGGSSAGQRMTDAGFQFSGSWTWAENIVWQSERGAAGIADDVAQTHDALMNSPGHRANILNPDVTVVGIGIERGDYNGWDAVMVTQNFARTSAQLQLDYGAGGGSSSDPAPSTSPTTGDDILILLSAGNIKALAGDDSVTGSSGADVLRGNAGNDRIAGGNGSDKVIGNGGRDSLTGDAGDDAMIGGGGNDIIDGGTGNDWLNGGTGNDTFVFGPGNDRLSDFDQFNDAEVIDVRLAIGITSFSDLRDNHMMQKGANVLIYDDGGNTMKVKDVLIADLDPADFQF